MSRYAFNNGPNFEAGNSTEILNPDPTASHLQVMLLLLPPLLPVSFCLCLCLSVSVFVSLSLSLSVCLSPRLSLALFLITVGAACRSFKGRECGSVTAGSPTSATAWSLWTPH